MDFNQVLAHLQSQFSGQLVLYVDDIAKVLGKSEKAVANLIARDGLPFKIKTIGRNRCVDVFQVAQWLASDSQMAEEAVVLEVTPTKPQPKQAPVKRPYNEIELQILGSRQNTIAEFARFAARLFDPTEKGFMQDVARKIALSVSAPSAIVLTCKTRNFAGESDEVWTEQKFHLKNVLSASSHISGCRDQSSQAFAVSIVLRVGRSVLFDASSLGGIWAVAVNKAKFNFE